MNKNQNLTNPVLIMTKRVSKEKKPRNYQVETPHIKRKLDLRDGTATLNYKLQTGIHLFGVTSAWLSQKHG